LVGTSFGGGNGLNCGGSAKETEQTIIAKTVIKWLRNVMIVTFFILSLFFKLANEKIKYFLDWRERKQPLPLKARYQGIT